MPLGMLIGGVLLDRLGVRSVLLIAVVSYLVATVSMLFNAALREMDRVATVDDGSEGAVTTVAR